MVKCISEAPGIGGGCGYLIGGVGDSCFVFCLSCLNDKGISITETQPSTDHRVKSTFPQTAVQTAFHTGSSGHHSMLLLP